jgi:choline dehydrogenase-like flavoprotein
MVRFAEKTQVDFVVVGGGGAGAIVANELSTAGLQVVLLEQGPYLHEQDFEHDELKFKDIFDPPGIGREVLTRDHTLQPDTFRKTEKEKAVVVPFAEYGRCIGGGTVHFTGNYWRFHEVDFHERSKWGELPGTGLADWPITYAELEPYYTKAEWELGISGLAGANPFDPPRSKPYPLPPMPIKSSGVLLERGARKLGWHPYPAPSAILSQPYRGRAACAHCGFCEYFGCEWGAKSSTLASIIPAAEKTGRCEIRANSYVRKISTDERGRVDGVIYFDGAKQEHFQKAKVAVVCCNGAETPRLLLMSKSNLFPQGLANSSGLVGKYFMIDLASSCQGTFEHPLNDYKGVRVTRVVQDFYDSDPKRGFFGGGGIDTRFNFYPISFALYGLPPDAPRWGAGFKSALMENFNRTMTVYGHTTCLPLESNSISLDPEVKDAWGLPALRITYKCHPDDFSTMRFFTERSMELLDAAGATRKWAAPVEDATAAGHLMGTCRMGNDPKKSVVDKNHRAHDVPNLFIVDGSSFVTSGRNQPTCTIQALAYRAADNIIKMAKSGNIAAAV